MSAMPARTDLSGSPHVGAGSTASPPSRVRASTLLGQTSAVLTTPTLSPTQAPPAPATPVPAPSVTTPRPQTAVGPVEATPALAPRRADRRAALKLARRSQQRWAIAGCGVLAAAFGITVGILDVLH
ncbi:MAG TPA: hypothetical protein VHD39_01000 [Acidimicrobiales bacterium]|nr:hypothetical protein [Acidimicrobiales bacterium]